LQVASGLSGFVQTLRRVAERRTLADEDDAQLLERFAACREHAAFEELVRRHGRMVLGLCRRLVRNSEDADDAFQATFMTLARRANAIRRRESVGGWLYKVAWRIAIRARALAVRRGRREVPGTDLADLAAAPGLPADDLRDVLSEEVARLPEKHRLVVALCYMEGETVAEAARLLGCPRGTVLSRLSRARQRLQSRLTRRGVAPEHGVATLGFAGPFVLPDVPPRLAESAVSCAMRFSGIPAAAIGSVPASAAALSEGVLRVMGFNKMKVFTSFALLVTLVAGGTGLFAYRTALVPPPDSPDATASTFFSATAAQESTKAAATASAKPPAPKMDSAPGWAWVLTPRPKDAHEWAKGGVVCVVEADKAGAQLVFLAYNGNFDPAREQYRPVAYDEAGKRYLLNADKGGSSNSWGKGHVTMTCYRLDPKALSANKVAYVGVESNQGGSGK
jgi:RNA polymerase sigma factor (sigma-70 family)